MSNMIQMCKNRWPIIIELSCIRQLVFELHFFGPMTDPDEIRSLFSMLKGKTHLETSCGLQAVDRDSGLVQALRRPKNDRLSMDFSIIFKGLENVGLKLFRSQQSKTKTKLESVDDFLTLQNEKSTFMYVLSWLNPNPTICH